MIDVALLWTYAPDLFNGLTITLFLVAASLILGFVLAVPLAIARLSSRSWLAAPAYIYVYVFRATPLLAQVFLVYYGAGQFAAELRSLGLWWLFADPLNCALITFTLNTAAYQAEILRGAIRSVPVTQYEAALALSLPRHVIFAHIVLPQGMIVALRPFGNEVIMLIKGSAVASIITVNDLMGVTREAYAVTFQLQTYLWAAVLYLILVAVLRRLWDALERRLSRHLKVNEVGAQNVRTNDLGRNQHAGVAEIQARARGAL